MTRAARTIHRWLASFCCFGDADLLDGHSLTMGEHELLADLTWGRD